MNIEHLEYLLEIYRCRSINQASKKLFVSQPRLSIVLKNIEDELGYQIFTRTNTGIFPTEQGEKFIQSAEKMFQEYQKVKYIKEPSVHYTGLSISSCFSSLYSYIYFQFKKKYPMNEPVQEVFCEDTYFPQNIQSLVFKRNRIAVTYFNHKYKHDYEKYAKVRGMILYALEYPLPYRAIVPVGHPLTKKDVIYLRDLQQYPFVTYYDVNHKDITEMLNISSKMSFQFVSCRATYYDAIEHNGYVSISIDFAPEVAEQRQCVCLPIADAQYNLAAYIIPECCTLSRREKDFLEFFTKSVEAFSLRVLDNMD